jgi:hypothetical protein
VTSQQLQFVALAAIILNISQFLWQAIAIYRKRSGEAVSVA